MSNYNQQLDALSLQTNQAITVKNTTDSIDPVDVGGSITSLIEFLKVPLGKINEFDILIGSIPPVQSQGIEDDVYIQGGLSLVFWKKDNNAWVNKGTVSLGINIIDGNINVQPSISGWIVTASAGQWAINNVIYQTAVQTQFTVDPADLNFDRIDAIFADESNTISYVAGTASSNPDFTKPSTPANEIIICYVYVPNGSSAQLPYIIDGNNPTSSSSVNKTIINKLGSDVNSSGNLDLSAETIPANALYQVYISGISGYVAVNYDEINKIMGGFNYPMTEDIKIIFI